MSAERVPSGWTLVGWCLAVVAVLGAVVVTAWWWLRDLRDPREQERPPSSDVDPFGEIPDPDDESDAEPLELGDALPYDAEQRARDALEFQRLTEREPPQ